MAYAYRVRIVAGGNVDNPKRLIDEVKQIALDILGGAIAPYDGGRRIWDLQVELKSGDHRLDSFVYWVSEYDDASDAERQKFCEGALRQAASSLIDHGSSV